MARYRGALLGMVVLTLGIVGLSVPSPRTLQLWPDRNAGVTSGLLEGVSAPIDLQMLPFGVCHTDTGDVVQARTYLHFPLDVFPPGTEILHATLYVYVDGVSGTGEATFGTYRVLEPWGEDGWGSDPAAWPALLTAPIAVTAARFDVVTPTLPGSAPVSTPTSTLAPAATPTATLTPTATPTATLTPTATPTTTLTPTATPSATLTPPATPTTTLTPTATPTPSSTPAAPAVMLAQVTGTWLTWDVTALMRAWQAGEVPNHGLALAPAPNPDADPETAGDLLVARWLAAADPDTRPHLIVAFEVHPVTPTPTSTPAPLLPPAGNTVEWEGVGLLLIGATLLILGLAGRRKQG